MTTKFLKISEKNVLEGIVECLTTALQLANEAEIIVKSDMNKTHALGLYIFAIEEYGKALVLKQCLNNNSECYVTRDLFSGEDAHKTKIDSAFCKLPELCKKYKSEEHTTGESNSPGLSISLTSYVTGPTNLPLRMRCFYLNPDKRNHRWEPKPTVDTEWIKEALRLFKEHIQNEIRNFENLDVIRSS